jgi:hypothetical protein
MVIHVQIYFLLVSHMVSVMVFNATSNNISVIWRSVLLLEETRVPGENHLPPTNHFIT